MKKCLALFLMVSFNAIAGTDYSCVSNCTQQGYMYNYCKSACSYPDAISPNEQIVTPQIRQTDYKCVNDCTSKGYQYNFCTSRCSY